ncbi:MAG: hypothetical protein L0H31_07580 [Nocardioidaceae bacterium]|nr:hypothetical protein [Nocardioidaceae bacterium]
MRERWRSGVALLACVLVLGGLIVAGPGDEFGALRRVLGFGADRLKDPADIEPGGTYAFLQHQPGDADDPVTWEPCSEIHYEINPTGAPSDNDEAIDAVQDAVAEVSSITGLVFAYEGTTDRRPQWKRQLVPVGGRDPVLISWAEEDEVEQLEGNVAGIGGAVAQGVDGGWRRYVTGGVTLDGEDLADADDGARRAILLHELGHLVGLDHVDSTRELMFADNLGRLDFAQGDLNGLVRLGQGRCR